MGVANGSDDDGREFGRWWIPIAGLLFVDLLLWVTQLAWTSRAHGTSWTELKQLVAEDRIEEVTFEGDWVRAKKKGDEQPNVVQVVRVGGDDEFLRLLEEHKVAYGAVQPNPCAQGGLPLLLVPLLMLALFWVLLTRQ